MMYNDVAAFCGKSGGRERKKDSDRVMGTNNKVTWLAIRHLKRV